MGILTDVTVEQIDIAIDTKRTFAVTLLPGSSNVLWFEGSRCTDASPNGTALAPGPIYFDISPWLQPFDRRWRLGNDNPIHDLMQPYKVSMTRDEYIKAVTDLVEICRHRNGKTVFSRTICGEIPRHESEYSWGMVADRFFTRLTDTFRYICYSPETGGWMGATPELLLEFDKTTGMFRTMAIAGTRKKQDVSVKWDKKNIRENRFVSEYIYDTLHEIGVESSISPLHNVTYGNIEHLCADIYGITSLDRLSDIIDAINPTPALCGFPKNDALADLAIYEPHKRYLYGGFIGIDTVEKYSAFVNLRCIHFDQNNYCIYGGGGIVAESIPAMEYEETVAKTSPLVELLTFNRCIESEI